MLIYPAIDMKEGRCVRLLQGREADVTDYGSPVEVAQRWAAEGAQWIHLVDLDGAFRGTGKNRETIKAIMQTIRIPAQLGGGIRTMEDITECIEHCGVSRVILGTAALENPSLVETACRAYPGKIAVGIDARGGRVAVRGWVEQSEMSALALALQVRAMGVTHIIYTDIEKDGMMEGANTAQTAQLIADTGMQIIGSGGISTIEDIQEMKAAGCEGVITGKALYTGAFRLAQAIAAAQ